MPEHSIVTIECTLPVVCIKHHWLKHACPSRDVSSKPHWMTSSHPPMTSREGLGLEVRVRVRVRMVLPIAIKAYSIASSPNASLWRANHATRGTCSDIRAACEMHWVKIRNRVEVTVKVKLWDTVSGGKRY
jgi:hypothetical protein